MNTEITELIPFQKLIITGSFYIFLVNVVSVMYLCLSKRVIFRIT